ncbi:MAG TPA: hypothetical protein VLJ10_04850, partial [Candidatus Bathyarchaeia archaeon]|nr:hypothetical protein [Candidatus Bathyarchaeia archaeon]
RSRYLVSAYGQQAILVEDIYTAGANGELKFAGSRLDIKGNKTIELKGPGGTKVTLTRNHQIEADGTIRDLVNPNKVIAFASRNGMIYATGNQKWAQGKQLASVAEDAHHRIKAMYQESGAQDEDVEAVLSSMERLLSIDFTDDDYVVERVQIPVEAPKREFSDKKETTAWVLKVTRKGGGDLSSVPLLHNYKEVTSILIDPTFEARVGSAAHVAGSQATFGFNVAISGFTPYVTLEGAGVLLHEGSHARDNFERKTVAFNRGGAARATVIDLVGFDGDVLTYKDGVDPGDYLVTEAQKNPKWAGSAQSSTPRGESVTYRVEALEQFKQLFKAWKDGDLDKAADMYSRLSTFLPIGRDIDFKFEYGYRLARQAVISNSLNGGNSPVEVKEDQASRRVVTVRYEDHTGKDKVMHVNGQTEADAKQTALNAARKSAADSAEQQARSKNPAVSREAVDQARQDAVEDIERKFASATVSIGRGRVAEIQVPTAHGYEAIQVLLDPKAPGESDADTKRKLLAKIDTYIKLHQRNSALREMGIAVLSQFSPLSGKPFDPLMWKAAFEGGSRTRLSDAFDDAKSKLQNFEELKSENRVSSDIQAMRVLSEIFSDATRSEIADGVQFLNTSTGRGVVVDRETGRVKRFVSIGGSSSPQMIKDMRAKINFDFNPTPLAENAWQGRAGGAKAVETLRAFNQSAVRAPEKLDTLSQDLVSSKVPAGKRFEATFMPNFVNDGDVIHLRFADPIMHLQLNEMTSFIEKIPVSAAVVGNDYLLSDVVRHFQDKSNKGKELNKIEEEVRETLIEKGVLAYTPQGGYTALKDNVVIITTTQDPTGKIVHNQEHGLAVARHELRHARYMLDPAYRAEVKAVYESLSGKDRKFVDGFLAGAGYDLENTDLKLREFDAYFSELPEVYRLLNVDPAEVPTKTLVKVQDRLAANGWGKPGTTAQAGGADHSMLTTGTGTQKVIDIPLPAQGTIMDTFTPAFWPGKMAPVTTPQVIDIPFLFGEGPADVSTQMAFLDHASPNVIQVNDRAMLATPSQT